MSEVERGEFGGILDANNREVYVAPSVIDDAPGAILQALSMGQHAHRPVVELRLCDRQVDDLIADLLAARRQSGQWLREES